jgi:hypothetical protein
MAKVILGKFKEDFEVNNCLERGNYTGGEFGYTPCLKNEKFLLKKGTTFQSKGYAIQPDDSNVDIAYQNGQFNVPLSKVEILGYKDINTDEFMNFKNNLDLSGSKISLDTTTIQNPQSQNQQVSFLESHPKLLMAVFIGIGLYIGYKKFIK